uniref:PadR domain-containing protein n=1 Tax=Caenorhabditis tropicalis TaxID=1561998 RepID=A0A1I7V1U3_9PELO
MARRSRSHRLDAPDTWLYGLLRSPKGQYTVGSELKSRLEKKKPYNHHDRWYITQTKNHKNALPVESTHSEGSMSEDYCASYTQR